MFHALIGWVSSDFCKRLLGDKGANAAVTHCRRLSVTAPVASKTWRLIVAHVEA